jgi:hypothetical protein
MDVPMEAVRGHDAVKATVILKDPEKQAGAKAREITGRMNDHLLAYVRSRLPEQRVPVAGPGDEWSVSLSVADRDRPTAGGGTE